MERVKIMVHSKSERDRNSKNLQDTINKLQESLSQDDFEKASGGYYYNFSPESTRFEEVPYTTAELPYQCQLCNVSFERKGLLSNHIKSHDENMYSCSDCGKSFPTRALLASHCRVHTNARNFSCELCDKKFTQKTNRDRHQEIHYGRRNFKCNRCGKFFSQKGNLKIHMESEHYGIRYPCDVCHKEFKQKTHLKVHMRTHTGSHKFGCEVCGKTFIQKVNCQRHLLVHGGEGAIQKRSTLPTFTCHDCGKGFTQKNALFMHITGVHLGVVYVCPYCGKEFKTQSAYKLHVKIHVGLAAFVCTICGKQLSSAHHLKGHMWTQHTEKPLQCTCDFCGKSFKRHDIRRHIMVFHLSSASVICELCGEAFLKKKDLLNHKSYNHGTPMTCEFCGKVCPSKMRLDFHLRNHFEYSKTRCFICKNYFNSVEEHMLEHPCEVCGIIFTAYKPWYKHTRYEHVNYDCGECSQRFLTEASFVDHFRSHLNGEKSFPCQYCSKGFTSVRFFLNHLDKEHDQLGNWMADFKKESTTENVETYIYNKIKREEESIANIEAFLAEQMLQNGQTAIKIESVGVGGNLDVIQEEIATGVNNLDSEGELICEEIQVTDMDHHNVPTICEETEIIVDEGVEVVYYDEDGIDAPNTNDNLEIVYYDESEENTMEDNEETYYEIQAVDDDEETYYDETEIETVEDHCQDTNVVIAQAYKGRSIILGSPVTKENVREKISSGSRDSLAHGDAATKIIEISKKIKIEREGETASSDNTFYREIFNASTGAEAPAIKSEVSPRRHADHSQLNSRNINSRSFGEIATGHGTLQSGNKSGVGMTNKAADVSNKYQTMIKLSNSALKTDAKISGIRGYSETVAIPKNSSHGITDPESKSSMPQNNSKKSGKMLDLKGRTETFAIHKNANHEFADTEKISGKLVQNNSRKSEKIATGRSSRRREADKEYAPTNLEDFFLENIKEEPDTNQESCQVTDPLKMPDLIGCDDCNSWFEATWKYDEHRAYHDALSNRSKDRCQCLECSLEFKNRSLVIEHLKEHIGMAKQLCKLCKRYFPKEKAFLEHLKNHYVEITMPQCPNCSDSESFKDEGKLRFVCVCDDIFDDLQTFETHMDVFIKGDGGRSCYKCGQCGHLYSTLLSLQQHMIAHMNNKKSPRCKICDTALPKVEQ